MLTGTVVYLETDPNKIAILPTGGGTIVVLDVDNPQLLVAAVGMATGRTISYSQSGGVCTKIKVQ